ncbi:MAG TPA: thioredoxin domain-containing protein [Vicinamibacterales bacterium]
MSSNDKRTNRPPTAKTKGKPVRVASAPPKRSPVLMATIGAVAAGLILVVILVVMNGLPGGTPTTLAAPEFESPAALADGRSLGDTDAPIAIDVWADYQCPWCGVFTEQIESLIVPLYVQPGHARLTFRDLAFLGPESIDAAVAARVAGDQGGNFWPYHDMLFANQHGENQGAFTRERLADIAVAVGLDRQAFLAAMDDPKYLAAVQQETGEGNALGIRSTPTMIINGQPFDALLDWAKVAAYLDSLVAAASGAPDGTGSPTP